VEHIDNTGTRTNVNLNAYPPLNMIIRGKISR